jgi:glycosyltransferase involved in cell wall biosynthesis
MHIAVGYNWFPTGAAHHFERALRELGYEVTYVGLGSAERPGYQGTTSIDAIIANLSHAPDFYLLIDPIGRYFPFDIKKLAIPTACYLIDVHLGTWRQTAAQFFDIVFVAQKDYVDTYRRAVNHDQVYWLPLAAASDVHRNHDLPRVYEVGFVGNIVLPHRKTARARRLRMIANRFKTNDFYRTYSPEEVGQVYSQSRIVFNTSIAGDVTMRVFEGTACGALLLTDSEANGLGDLFDIGHEVVTYADDNDMLNKITYFLAHEEERAQIANAGYQRAQAQHTYCHRAQYLLDKISDPSLRLLAPMRQADQTTVWAAQQKVFTHLHMVDAILDQARSANLGPLARLRAVLPALLRRLLI